MKVNNEIMSWLLLPYTTTISLAIGAKLWSVFLYATTATAMLVRLGICELELCIL